MKIMIVEFNDFHEEVILSQLNFLIKERDINIHLFINNNLSKKVDFYKFLNNSLKINLINSKNKWTKFISLYKIREYIIKHNIDIVIFNTYECKYAKILFKFINKSKISIIHNADKFLAHKTSKNINNFFVLNKTVFETIRNAKQDINISYFYPLIDYKIQRKSNKNNKIKIVIPGLIELSRRDYLGFIELINTINLERYEFILLGNILKNDGPIVYKMLEENRLLNRVKIYKGFIPYDEYFTTISNADLIMPLIHPNVKNFEKYHKTKITAAFTMSFSFKIPLFLYEDFKKLDEYRNFSIFYNLDSFKTKLNTLDKENINLIKNIMEHSKEISFEKQKNKYIEFLRKAN